MVGVDAGQGETTPLCILAQAIEVIELVTEVDAAGFLADVSA
jgi:hypothetical protein